MNKKTENTDLFTLKNFHDIFKSHWVWFLVSVVYCMLLAGVYVLRQAPKYTRTAQLLIKEEGGSLNSIGDFSGIDLFNQPSNTYNEKFVIQSPDIMLEVVRRLNLNNSYTQKKLPHNVSLYGDAIPVNIYLDPVDTTKTTTFKVTFDDKNSFEIEKFRIGKDKISHSPVDGTFGKSISTPVGNIVITKNKSFAKIKEFPYTIIFTHKRAYACALEYCKLLKVSPVETKASVLEISLTDVSTRRADDILNTLIDEYNKAWAADKTLMAVNTSHFLRERLNSIEKELSNVDDNISEYKTTNLLPDIAATSALYMQQANEANEKLLEINNQLYMAKHLKDYISHVSNDQTIPVNSGFESQSLAALISTYNLKVIERNNLISVSSENNPAVLDMNNALANMRSAVISSINNQIATLENTARTTSKYEGNAVSHIASSPQQAKYLVSVERQQKVKESLYLFLLQKLEENEITNSYAGTNNRVIAKPGGNGEPVSPKPIYIFIAAFFLGMALPFAYYLLRQQLSNVISSRDELESLSVPFIGEVPFFGKKNRKPLKEKFFKRESAQNEETNLVVDKGNRNLINEAFRLLRTNLELLIGNKTNENVIAVTSFNPGSGKSFITMNLATVLTFKNKRALVVDCDMRHGSTSQYIGFPRTGLVDYLSGKTDNISDIIYNYPGNSELHVIPIGKIPPNPTELLENGRIEKLIDELRNNYDYIFMDCPPIDIVADTQIIEQFTNRTIFVVRVGLLEKAMVPDIDRLYKNHVLKNMCLVVNGISIKASRYYSSGSKSHYYINN